MCGRFILKKRKSVPKLQIYPQLNNLHKKNLRDIFVLKNRYNADLPQQWTSPIDKHTIYR